ncbi:unnamed protein product [Musa textilis]
MPRASYEEQHRACDSMFICLDDHASPIIYIVGHACFFDNHIDAPNYLLFTFKSMILDDAETLTTQMIWNYIQHYLLLLNMANIVELLLHPFIWCCCTCYCLLCACHRCCI